MPDLFERILMLKSVPIFSGIKTEDLQLMAQILEEEPWLAGEVVFRAGDPSDKVYVIASGRVAIIGGASTRESDIVAMLGANECFGEMGAFDNKPRSATAKVAEDATLLSLDKAKLRELISRHPELALGLLQTLSERLRQAVTSGAAQGEPDPVTHS